MIIEPIFQYKKIIDMMKLHIYGGVQMSLVGMVPFDHQLWGQT
jgi:hypothetical protein